MVPITADQFVLGKRSSTDAGFDTFNSPKIRVKHHKLHWKQPEPNYELSFCQDEEAIQQALSRSIGLALEAVGFEQADPLALESFRLLTEEYMDRFLANIRQSMLSCRRTLAVAQDYLYALHACQLSLRALLPHLDPPVPPSKSQVPFSRDSGPEDKKSTHHAGIEPLLKQAADNPVKTFLPQHFPSFPSKHTYKSTAQFTHREEDARKLREQATEEGRMGEEALRRLVGTQASPSEGQHRSMPKPKRALKKEREDKWKEAMEAVLSEGGTTNGVMHDPGGMEIDEPQHQLRKEYLGAMVNADMMHWRKPVVRKVKTSERVE
ncbi:MAG: hypothetical protein MMC33_008146 [Icmadophila ericetorum]|nr:hypothetical protein [Icmadophila ericetorum]